MTASAPACPVACAVVLRPLSGGDSDNDRDASPTPRARHEEGEPAHQIPPAVLQGLTEALKDSDAEVRKQAMQALARIHAPGYADVIAPALKDPDAEVRQQAAFALSQMRDQRAVPSLIAALKDTDGDVRQQDRLRARPAAIGGGRAGAVGCAQGFR